MKSKIICHVLVILFFLVISAYAQETTNVSDIVTKKSLTFLTLCDKKMLQRVYLVLRFCKENGIIEKR